MPAYRPLLGLLLAWLAVPANQALPPPQLARWQAAEQWANAA